MAGESNKRPTAGESRRPAAGESKRPAAGESKRPAAGGSKRPAARDSHPPPPEVLAAAFIAEARDPRALPPPGPPEIAFAGRSNVGKSTLLNRLAGRRALARTSKTPGRTRGIVFFDLELARPPERPRPLELARPLQSLRFVDLPGYGYARVAREERESWQGLIESYAEGRPTLALFAVLVDARRGIDDEERQLYEWLGTIHVPAQIVLTKVDKLSATERGRLRAQAQAILKPVPGARRAAPILASGETGEGVGALWAAIEDAAAAVASGTGEFATARGPA